jgi:site-specific DNA-methyltransferase (adenine-specific)
MPILEPVNHVIADPPYEKEAHRKDRRIMRKSGLVAGALSFEKIVSRDQVTAEAVKLSNGWLIFFCQAEGIAPWRDAIELAGAKYKAPMIWVKPDGMPQFNV